MPTPTATPAKLRNGNWGARVKGAVSEGEEVTITIRSGKSWTARVTRVLWTGNGVSLCAVSSGGNSHSRPRRAANGECQCGACEDLLSFGYRPGQRIRCPECGGWAEAY